MAKFLMVETIYSEKVTTARVGTTGAPLTQKDVGKAVKLIAESNYGLAAAGDPREAGGGVQRRARAGLGLRCRRAGDRARVRAGGVRAVADGVRAGGGLRGQGGRDQLVGADLCRRRARRG